MAGVSAETRALIWQRDESQCRRCYRLGEQIHHRHPRQMGGTNRPWVNRPGNLVLLCSNCHEWIELNRTAATDRGWLVPEGINPVTVPILTVWGDIYLDHEGGVRAAEGANFW